MAKVATVKDLKNWLEKTNVPDDLPIGFIDDFFGEIFYISPDDFRIELGRNRKNREYEKIFTIEIPISLLRY